MIAIWSLGKFDTQFFILFLSLLSIDLIDESNEINAINEFLSIDLHKSKNHIEITPGTMICSRIK